MLGIKLFVTYVSRNQEKKCGGCNWETGTFYGLGTSKEQARGEFKGINPPEYGLGLCASCMCELLTEEGYEIIPTKIVNIK